jgi:hypothetical protein
MRTLVSSLVGATLSPRGGLPMMVISDLEVVGLLQFAVRHTGTKLGISNVDWKSIPELLDEIQAIDLETNNLLRAFLNTYIDWFHFHQQIDRLGKSGHLDNTEQAELVELVTKRNATRDAVIARLAAIG